jgi:predicted tellurium resistance membrane protein TerC
LFSQTFEIHDIFVVLILVVLEGVLSIDNALVLGLLARRLPESQRAKALSYGLIGALIFRIVAIFLAGWMLRWNFVKLIGGGYLIYLAGKSTR